MASEDFVSFSIMQYLKENGWYILQYHPPGGQACFALKVLGDIVYPDIIAYKHGEIFLLENKGRFALSDISKLRRMISDDNCKEQIQAFVKNYLTENHIYLPQEFTFLWGHGYSGKIRTEVYGDICLVYVSELGQTCITYPI